MRRELLMKSLKVALLQILPEKTLEQNRQKGFTYCKKAKEMGADIALFPEMWSVGYCITEDVNELKPYKKYSRIYTTKDISTKAHTRASTVHLANHFGLKVNSLTANVPNVVEM